MKTDAMQRKTPSRKTLSWVVGVALSWIVTAPATADILVMKDGAHVQTKGSWNVKGSVVVFTLPNGTLSSVRTREVDLDRSAQATAAQREEMERDAEENEPPPRRVVREITSETVPLASPKVLAAEAAAAAGEETEESDTESASGPNRLLEIADWQRTEQPDGSSEIVGHVRNKTENAVGQVAVRITVYGDGEVLKSGYAFLAAPALGPRRETSFRMPLEDVFVYDDVRFDLEGMEIMLRPTGSAESTANEEGPSS